MTNKVSQDTLEDCRQQRAAPAKGGVLFLGRSALSLFDILRKMLLGYRFSEVVFAAIEMDIPRILQAGPMEATEIAVAVGADHTAMKYMLRALASINVLNHLENNRYELGDLGVGLLDVQTGELASALACHKELYYSWSSLSKMVKTGEPAFAISHRMSFWDYLKSHPEAREQASTLVTVTMRAKQRALLTACDFSRFQRVVDIGGAHGTLLKAILNEHPHLSGVLFDLPEVISDVHRSSTLSEFDGRCDLVAGSFFSGIPDDGDVYILARVLHNWDDQRAATILSNCYRAMDRGQTLLVIEKTPCADDFSVERVMADLNMFVMFGSHERTEEEYASLLTCAGFHLECVTMTDTALSIIEAVRI